MKAARTRVRRKAKRAPDLQVLASELASLRQAIERLTEALVSARHDSLADVGMSVLAAADVVPAAGLGFAERFPFGVWQSHDTLQRWHLDFNDNGCQWTERAADGTTLVRQVDLGRSGSTWRIERPNDADVLRFLGASPAVVDDILARGPQPSFITIEVLPDRIEAEWNGLRWTLDAQGRLQSLEQPGSAPSTVTQYALMCQGDDAPWFTVAEGQVTFDEEGQEGTRFHSRWLHWPGGASGVTLGRGYDMGQRSAVSIRSDLIAAGVAQAVATAFADGAGLTGSAASDFVAQKRHVCGNLTPGQQRRLFAAVFDVLEADTKRICDKADVVAKYGAVDFTALDARIWTVVVDLRFRGDYTPAARAVMQKAVVDNDLAAFKAALSDRTRWSNVPQARFDARVKALD
jgi:hypothetical protein